MIRNSDLKEITSEKNIEKKIKELAKSTTNVYITNMCDLDELKEVLDLLQEVVSEIETKIH